MSYDEKKPYCPPHPPCPPRKHVHEIQGSVEIAVVKKPYYPYKDGKKDPYYDCDKGEKDSYHDCEKDKKDSYYDCEKGKKDSYYDCDSDKKDSCYDCEKDKKDSYDDDCKKDDCYDDCRKPHKPCPEFKKEAHNHRFAKVSGPEIPLGCKDHYHEVKFRTDSYEGHYHEFCGKTGGAIKVGDRHVHFLKGQTTCNAGHKHDFRTATLIEDPIGD